MSESDRQIGSVSGLRAADSINTAQSEDIMNLFQDYHINFGEADVTATPIEETGTNVEEGVQEGVPGVSESYNLTTGQNDDLMNLFQDYQVTNDEDLRSKESVQPSTTSLNDNPGDKLSDIKDLCLRTDLSALAKIDKILKIIDPSHQDVSNITSSTASTPLKEPKTVPAKRPKDLKNLNSPSKIPKLEPEKEKNGASEESSFPDSGSGCVVCGMSLKVFRSDVSRELSHYLSHGFRVLKEFDILKADDSLFLMCNLCTCLYPRKCQKTFRDHLVADHAETIVDIFRCI